MLLVASCYRNWDKLRPDEPLGSYADFTFTFVSFDLFEFGDKPRQYPLLEVNDFLALLLYSSVNE